MPVDLSDDSLARFVRRVVGRRAVWLLVEPRGKSAACVAASDRHGSGGAPVPVQLFFSERAAAARLRQDDWAGHVPASVSVEALVGGILPEMVQAGHLVGPDYGPDLAGMELDPLVLKAALEAAGVQGWCRGGGAAGADATGRAPPRDRRRRPRGR
jgi:hypothetical protein